MPNTGFLGWAYVTGSAFGIDDGAVNQIPYYSDTRQLTGSYFVSSTGFGNISTINVASTVPEGYNSVLYGPITIGAAGTLTIGADSVVKIKDIDDV